VTQEDAAQYWRDAANEEWEAAQVLQKNGMYRVALFHCHLAVEKALKAAYVREYNASPPPLHDLLDLAVRLSVDWTDDQKQQLEDLTRYVIDARYADPAWAGEQATDENARLWLQQSKEFLSLLES
jgi:HEPN domain-containing protein